MKMEKDHNMIEELLEKYFEGETSAEEEKFIRKYFSSGVVAEHLLSYQPLFAYFDEEIAGMENTMEKPVKTDRKRIIYLFSGIAAAILLLLGIGQVFFFPGNRFCSGNYVVINGRCYTDIHTIKEYARNALEEVSSTSDEVFPFIIDDEDSIDKIVIENQLKELGDFFLDD